MVKTTLDSLKKEIGEIKTYLNSFNSRLETIEEKVGIESYSDLAVEQAEPVIENSVENKKNEKAERTNFEANFGIKWLGIIGIICLTIGLAFFLKYSYDQGWISPLGRVIVGVLVGLSLIVGGEIFNRKEYMKVARLLTGGGFAGLYFSIFSAYFFETYRAAIGISLGVDIFLLSIVVILSMIFAIKYDSMAIIGCSFFLGYMTNFLCLKFEFVTLLYCLILTIALVVVTSYKRWGMITVAGLVTTYVHFMVWYDENYWSNPAYALLFLIAYFGIFIAATFRFKDVAGRKDLGIYSVMISVINSFFFYAFFMYWMDKNNFDAYFGLFTLGYAVIYFLLSYMTSVVGQRKTLLIGNLTLCILFLTLTVPIQIDEEFITIIWALEFVGLLFLSLRLKSLPLRVLSYVLGFIVAFKTLFVDSWMIDYRFVSYLISIGSFFAAKKMIEIEDDYSWEIVVSKFFDYSIIAMLVFSVALEMSEIWISVGWGLLAIAILGVGFYYKSKEKRIAGILLFLLTLLKLFLYDMAELDTVFRFISFFGLGIILLGAAFLYSKYKNVILGD